MQKSAKHPFFNTIKAYCFMKTNKLVECEELINDIKPSKQTDPYVILYLVFIYTAFS